MTHNAVDGTTKLYLLVGASFMLESITQDVTDDYLPLLSGTDHVMGFFHDDSSTVYEFAFTGEVDQVRIWNGVVDPSEVLTTLQNPDVHGQLLAYPNPADATLWLQLPSVQTGTVQVMDPTGP